MKNRLIYAASESCADLWYEAGFAAPDPFLWFETASGRGVCVSALEFGRAQKQCRPGTQVIDTGKLSETLGVKIPARSKLNRSSWLAQMVGIVSRAKGVRVWNVPADFPLEAARQLEAAGLRLKVLSPFSPGRSIKRPDEIEAIRRSERLAEAGLAAADALLADAVIAKDGTLKRGSDILTAEMLQGAINAEIARLGGSAQGTIAAPGPQGADPHQTGHGPIRAGEPIVIDIFPRDQKSGYFGDLTRTRVKGQAPEQVMRTYETVLTAQRQVLSKLKAGVRGCEMQLLTEEIFQQAGYETGADPATGVYHGFFHSLGHSVGMEIHEGPGLSRRKEPPLAAGNVVTVEPGLYYPEWGGIRIEDTVAITKDGIDNLAVAPKHLLIP